MTILRTDRNQTFDRQGNLLSEEVVQVDVTAEVTKADLLQKAANALAANSAFLADPSVTNAEAVTQLKALTRQVNALIRLAREDLLVENTDT